jgi:hypothetical protein
MKKCKGERMGGGKTFVFVGLKTKLRDVYLLWHLGTK